MPAQSIQSKHQSGALLKLPHRRCADAKQESLQKLQQNQFQALHGLGCEGKRLLPDSRNPHCSGKGGALMSTSTRYWVVERDAAGDCVGDYLSAATHQDALKLFRQMYRTADADTVSIELGKIIDFEGPAQSEQVLKVREVAR
jgi:hypothetical protein